MGERERQIQTEGEVSEREETRTDTERGRDIEG